MRGVLIYRHQLFKASEVFITQQAQAMERFTPIFVGRKKLGVSPRGFNVVSLEESPLYNHIRLILLRDSRVFLELVKQYKPKLIHAHFGVDGVYALELAHSLGVPLVTTFHGFDVTRTTGSLLFSGRPSLINYVVFRKRLAAQGALFICVSEYIRNRLINLGFPVDRTITHYIGVDTAAIRPQQECPQSKVILHVARLVEKKGTQYLIHAFSRVVRKCPDTQLVIIGEGPLRPQLERLAISAGLQQQVIFLGARPHSEVLNWMSKASVFCLPSVTSRSGDSEGLGIVLLEAQATGVPVVATRHGGIPEAVIDGITGFLVPERDVEILADRLIYLLENRDERRKMGRAARSMVEEKFDLKRQTAKLEEIYEGLL